MPVYALIMYAAAAALAVVGILVYRGNTGLIHAYHQTRVKDKPGYARSVERSLIGLALPLIAAGTLGLFTTSALPALVLIVGLIIAVIPLVRAQKKYNGGVF